MAAPRAVAYGVTALLGAGLAYASFSNALGNVEARMRPALALQQVGADPTSGLRALDLPGLVHQSQEERAEAAASARRSLRAQALNPLALTVLGVVADSDGKPDAAARLLNDAHKLSRRVLVAELWLLERSVIKESVPDVITQYDIILRQSQDFQRVAFPVLDAAMADPAIERAFRPYVLGDTPWMGEFLGTSVSSSPSPNLVAGMLLRAGAVRRALDLQVDVSTLFRRLAETGHADMIRPFYLATGKGKPALLTSVTLDEHSADQSLAPVAWRFAQGSDLSAQILLDEAGAAVINVKTSSAKPQMAADKLLFLAPGRYRLGFDLQSVSGRPSSVRWSAVCLGTGAPRLAGTTGNLATEDSKVQALEFDVGSDCAAIQLVFEVAADTDNSDLEANLGKLRLDKVGAGVR